MKEVTYEEWQKNPTPRMMWVWNDDVENKEKTKVAYVLNNNNFSYRVLSITDEDSAIETFKHCAEIEEARFMTHRELARWLSEKPFREFKYGRDTHCSIYSFHTYTEDEASKEVSASIVIREDGGKWKAPLIEE